MITANADPTSDLIRSRTRTLGKSLFRKLRGEGFSHEQIIELSGILLDLVTEELTPPTTGIPVAERFTTPRES